VIIQKEYIHAPPPPPTPPPLPDGCAGAPSQQTALILQILLGPFGAAYGYIGHWDMFAIAFIPTILLIFLPFYFILLPAAVRSVTLDTSKCISLWVCLTSCLGGLLYCITFGVYGGAAVGAGVVGGLCYAVFFAFWSAIRCILGLFYQAGVFCGCFVDDGDEERKALLAADSYMPEMGAAHSPALLPAQLPPQEVITPDEPTGGCAPCKAAPAAGCAPCKAKDPVIERPSVYQQKAERAPVGFDSGYSQIRHGPPEDNPVPAALCCLGCIFLLWTMVVWVHGIIEFASFNDIHAGDGCKLN